MTTMQSLPRWAIPLTIVVLGVGAALVTVSPVEANGSSTQASSAQVTVYGANWCGPCKTLEKGLQEKGIPFEVVDIDANPGAWEIARKASGSNGIPVTSVIRGPHVRWIVGANVNAVEQAYKDD